MYVGAKRSGHNGILPHLGGLSNKRLKTRNVVRRLKLKQRYMKRKKSATNLVKIKLGSPRKKVRRTLIHQKRKMMTIALASTVGTFTYSQLKDG